MWLWLAQLPTPTPFPNGTAPLQLDRADFSIWKSTDEAIHLWRMGGQGVQLTIQIVLILGVIILAFFALSAWIRALNSDTGDV